MKQLFDDYLESFFGYCGLIEYDVTLLED